MTSRRRKSNRPLARLIVMGALMLSGGAALNSHAMAGQSFAGTWALDLANCKTPQERSDAPMILTEKGFDQHETHCRFTSVKPGGDGEWKVFGSCSVEGDQQPLEMGIVVSGDTLTLMDVAGARDFLRCP